MDHHCRWLSLSLLLNSRKQDTTRAAPSNLYKNLKISSSHRWFYVQFHHLDKNSQDIQGMAVNYEFGIDHPDFCAFVSVSFKIFDQTVSVPIPMPTSKYFMSLFPLLERYHVVTT